MRLRQVALVARDLADAVDALTQALGIEVGFRDPGVAVFGLENAVMPVGDTFLEVVSPARAGTSAGRLLKRRGGDGGYMVIVQSDELAEDRRRLAALGVRVVWEATLDDIATVHLHPRDVGAAILSLDVAEPAASWRWAGPEWERHVRRDGAAEITAAELQAADPAALASRWAEVLARPATPREEGFEIALDRGAVRFVRDLDGRGEGLGGIEVAAADPERLRAALRERGEPGPAGTTLLCGTRIAVVAGDG